MVSVASFQSPPPATGSIKTAPNFKQTGGGTSWETRLGDVCVVKCNDLLFNKDFAIPVDQKQGHNSEQTYGREGMKLDQQ